MKSSALNHVFALIWNAHLQTYVVAPETARGCGKGNKRNKRSQNNPHKHDIRDIGEPPTRRAAIGLRLKPTWLAVLAWLAPALALAGPSGGVVTGGDATITTGGNTTTINQSTPKAIIKWDSFSVAVPETVNFNQPNAASVTLNRVTGGEKSVINGALNANGQVFLINSAGVLFAPGSSVNVGGLVASTSNITDEDFNGGNYVFGKGSGAVGSVVNQGRLTAAEGGYIALLGSSVSNGNSGVITATKGTVALAAGDQITLNLGGNALASVTVGQGTLDALVENKQAIYADGGTVLLTAKAAGDLLDAQVNTSGIVQAQTLGDLAGNTQGNIVLNADGGTVTAGGLLDASAPTGGDGGTITTAGNTVKLASGVQVTTRAANGQSGNWQIAPAADFNIAATGGDISGAALSSQLANGGISIAPTGSGSNIAVNDAIAWDAPTTLALAAGNDIAINKPITGQYSAYDGAAAPAVKAGLALNAGHDVNINNAISLTNAALTLTAGDDYHIRTKASYSGTVPDDTGKPVAQKDTSGGVYGSVTFGGGLGSGDALNINGNTYTLVYDMGQLDKLDATDGVTGKGSFTPVKGYFAIANNMDASGVIYSYAPIYYFGGTLEGLGNSIVNFSMNDPPYDAGLIGNGTKYGPVTIRDLGMDAIKYTNVGRAPWTGGLMGEGVGTLYNDYSTGTASVLYGFGGLAGQFNGAIDQSYSNVDITSNGFTANYLGGIVGSLSGTISHSHATGNIDATVTLPTSQSSALGGLAGAVSGNIIDSYATGSVSSKAVDGLVSNSPPMLIGNNIGGLVGSYAGVGGSQLINSFATGVVTGGSNLGGLMGGFSGTGSNAIDNVYATGDVTGIQDATSTFSNAGIGGLIGGVFNDLGSPQKNISLSINNVFATGNIQAQGGGRDVGGLIGGLYSPVGTGSLTNAYATGNVSVANAYGDGVGGLVGNASNYTISNVYATGNVNGDSSVGGLVGVATNSNISNSYSTGAATAAGTGSYAKYGAGGLVGRSQNSSTTNTFYNGDANSQGIFSVFDSAGTPSLTHDATALNGSQVADSKYYANGTIDQVLADRQAAAEAAAQAAAEAAAQAAANQAAANAAAQAAANQAAAQAAANQAAANQAAAQAAANQAAANTAANAANQAAATVTAARNAAMTVGSGQVAQLLGDSASKPPVIISAVHSPVAAALDQNIIAPDESYLADICSLQTNGQTLQLRGSEGGDTLKGCSP